MADTLTPRYGWTQPDVGGDPTTWGTLLNADLGAIDKQVYANQQGLAPVGTIVMFGGPTAPANWLPCDGRSLSTAAPYDKLFAALGYAHGGSGANFNLPNFNGTFPTGAGGTNALGAKGGHATQTLAVANMPAHAHPITDVAHTHGITQSVHGHGITDPQHAHGVNDPQHAHGYTHIVSGGGPWGAGSLAASGSATTSLAPTGISIAASATGVQVQPQLANIVINAANTGITTTGNAGASSPTPVPTVPPWVAVLFVIRYQ